MTEKQIQARLTQLTGSRNRVKATLDEKNQQIAALKQQAAAMKGAAKGGHAGAKPNAGAAGTGG